MFSKPAALLGCVVVTIVWLWLTAHPLLRSRTPLHAHALHIDVPAAAAEGNDRIAVLVGAGEDAVVVSSWRAQMHHLHHQQALPAEPADPSSFRDAAPPFTCYGVHARQGRRDYMEDMHAVYLRHTLHYSNAKEEHLCSRDVEEGEAEVLSPWALFGVFDGHGGAKASVYAAAYLLPSLHSALLHQGFTGGSASSLAPTTVEPAAAALNVTSTFSAAFQQLDREFLELVARPQKRHDGSTALVAGLYHRADAGEGEAPFQLVVSNLGDCRAVLIQPSAEEDASTHSSEEEEVLLPAPAAAFAPRDVLALSTDHKPDLPTERAYVESHPGGFVTPARAGRSVARVQGILAVSRAIGDAPLKPWVRSEPDVRVVELEDWDQPALARAQCSFDEQQAAPSCATDAAAVTASPLLLLASDGFWDVFDNADAAQLTLDFLRDRARQPSSSADPVPALSALAHHLVTEAYLRGSFDNLTVMAIDVACMQRWLKQQRQR